MFIKYLYLVTFESVCHHILGVSREEADGLQPTKR